MSAEDFDIVATAIYDAVAGNDLLDVGDVQSAGDNTSPIDADRISSYVSLADDQRRLHQRAGIVMLLVADNNDALLWRSPVDAQPLISSDSYAQLPRTREVALLSGTD